MAAEELPALIEAIYAALAGLSAREDAGPPAAGAPRPATSLRKSLSNPAHIISMIDGKPYKTLRRHLSGHGLTPDDYRARYGLKADYPMVAETYSEARRAMAKKIGLGRKPGPRKPAAPTDGTAAPKAPRGRPKKTV